MIQGATPYGLSVSGAVGVAGSEGAGGRRGHGSHGRVRVVEGGERARLSGRGRGTGRKGAHGRASGCARAGEAGVWGPERARREIWAGEGADGQGRLRRDPHMGCHRVTKRGRESLRQHFYGWPARCLTPGHRTRRSRSCVIRPGHYVPPDSPWPVFSAPGRIGPHVRRSDRRPARLSGAGGPGGGILDRVHAAGQLQLRKRLRLELRRTDGFTSRGQQFLLPSKCGPSVSGGARTRNVRQFDCSPP